MYEGENKKIFSELDVICQHSKDGTIIPLRIRISDEEGELHSYTIHSYKDLSYKGKYVMPNGFEVTNRTMVFDCRIIVFDTKKTVRLYYDLFQNKWRLST